MAETIEQTKQRLEAFALELAPESDLAPGSVLSELTTKLAAGLHNKQYNIVQELSQESTIQDIINNPGDTYSEVIDKLASNYNVIRSQGKKVSGQIKVTVSQKRNYYMKAGFTFTQPNLQFDYVTLSDYDIVDKDPAIALNANELRLITEDAQYYFVVPVQATDVGTESTINNTQVTSFTRFSVGTGFSIPNFVQAEAFGNFSSGQNKETDKELIARFQEGMANKSATSPKSVESALKLLYPIIKGISVVGSNDPEVLRSKNNLFGISTLGMADVYARTSDSLETIRKTITATWVGSATWRISIDSNTVPGFYRVLSITPSSGNVGGTYDVISTSYGYSLNTNRNNNINNAAEARFTRYQTCTIDFTIDDGIVSPTTRAVSVLFLYSPLVQELQDYLVSDANRVACADYLLKAVVPCDVSVKLRLLRKNPLEDLPVTNIKRDIFDYINNLKFGEPIVVSKIIDLCHNYHIKRVDLPVQLTGSILIPGTGRDQYMEVYSEDEISIPNLPAQGITPNTTAFFVNYLQSDGQTDNIGIEVA